MKRQFNCNIVKVLNNCLGGVRAKGKDLMMQISITQVNQTIDRLIADNYAELA